MKRGRANGSRAQKWEKLLPIVVAASPVVGAKVSLSSAGGGRDRKTANINDMKNERVNKTKQANAIIYI